MQNFPHTIAAVRNEVSLSRWNPKAEQLWNPQTPVDGSGLKLKAGIIVPDLPRRACIK
jgi:hypothetical protein